MYILDIHNDIRNHVASGQESRGALGNQPPAADMFLLEWDEELEAIAQRWADQCISANAIVQHDKCRRTENFEVGQNVVTAISPDVQLPELSVLILNWYKQITSIIPSDVDEFTGIWRGKHQVGQYTQLVWAKTRLVGCAVAAFKETVGDAQYIIRFVCNYGPAGNVVGQSVYQRGKPCSRCPYRTCDEMRPNLCGANSNFGPVDEIYGQFHRRYIRKFNNLEEGDDCVCLFTLD
ncbi:venom allergen 3-like [Anoplophora glabripennis]|uniref:venom allergen 3-like n=1 Tax=Anoplophora glabripennis TaxID=217634 RepID=UPI000C77FF3E|nr:venom allergen 3-like [Anoplophora glabripennis]